MSFITIKFARSSKKILNRMGTSDQSNLTKGHAASPTRSRKTFCLNGFKVKRFAHPYYAHKSACYGKRDMPLVEA